MTLPSDGIVVLYSSEVRSGDLWTDGGLPRVRLGSLFGLEA